MNLPAKLLFAAALAALGFTNHTGSRSATNWVNIPHGKLCVTEGSIGQAVGNRLTVNVPKMRAFVTAATTQDVEARFNYLGQTSGASKLGSGEMRVQFGLKLRAQDPCNLVYAMWRIEPESKLVVSIKSNPGQHTSAECTNHGYRNIKPARSSPVPILRPGSAHTLRAEMSGEELHVYADDKLVWEGSLGAEARGLNGPVGMRSDNAHLELEFRAGQAAGAHPDFALACKPSPGESE